MDPSKLSQKCVSRSPVKKYTHAKHTKCPKKKEPVYSAYASDPDEYDDMSEMMDLGFN